MIEEFYKGYLGISHPYSHQKEMWNRIIERNFPLIVKAPTGSGKTEGVIAPFLYQFVENCRKSF
jgi:CRISPR-associated endonuclease/helicase Cas3